MKHFRLKDNSLIEEQLHGKDLLDELVQILNTKKKTMMKLTKRF